VRAPNETSRIARITFEGDEGAREDLLRLMQVDERFTRAAIDEQLERDQLGVRDFYAEHGHLLANIEMGVVTDQPPFVDIRVRIDAGPQFTIDKVTVLDAKTKAPIASPIATRVRKELSGETFSRTSLFEALATLESDYSSTGYADVVVEPRLPPLDRKRPVVNLELAVVRGPLVRIDHIVVVGNTTVSTPSILHHVVCREGGLYLPADVNETVRRLEATGLFRDVHASFHTDTPGHRTLTLEVKEGAPDARPSAMSFVEVAQRVRADGRRAEARALFAHIARAFPFTKAAAQAELERADIDFELEWFESAADEYSVGCGFALTVRKRRERVAALARCAASLRRWVAPSEARARSARGSHRDGGGGAHGESIAAQKLVAGSQHSMPAPQTTSPHVSPHPASPLALARCPASGVLTQ
jgi:hypothetical protein